jgi:S1-C subfamily serine protease
MRPAPETPPREEIKLQGRSPFAGATIVNYSPAVAEETGVEDINEGVVIADVEENSTAARVNLQKGDVVMAVNDARIVRTSDLEKAAAGRPRFWRLTIRRGGQVFQTVLGG